MRKILVFALFLLCVGSLPMKGQFTYVPRFKKGFIAGNSTYSLQVDSITVRSGSVYMYRGGSILLHAQTTVKNLSDSLLTRYTKTQANAKFTTLAAFNDTISIVGLALPYLKLTPSADPPDSPTEGMIYMDTDHHLYCYISSAWVRLDN